MKKSSKGSGGHVVDMGEGPGRFCHPGMFGIVSQIMARRDLAPGTYNLWDLAPKDDNSVKASISNYTRDPLSTDYRSRALVFGNESARISGLVVVDRNGSKTFKGVEIRPHGTKFNFKRKTDDERLEAARTLARKIYDPEDRGVSYEIPFHGTGRVYRPFTDTRLSAALRWDSLYPGRSPPGLLPSITDAPPPYIDQHLRDLNQAKGSNGQGLPSVAGGPACRCARQWKHLRQQYRQLDRDPGRRRPDEPHAASAPASGQVARYCRRRTDAGLAVPATAI